MLLPNTIPFNSIQFPMTRCLDAPHQPIKRKIRLTRLKSRCCILLICISCVMEFGFCGMINGILVVCLIVCVIDHHHSINETKSSIAVYSLEFIMTNFNLLFVVFVNIVFDSQICLCFLPSSLRFTLNDRCHIQCSG